MGILKELVLRTDHPSVKPIPPNTLFKNAAKLGRAGVFAWLITEGWYTDGKFAFLLSAKDKALRDRAQACFADLKIEEPSPCSLEGVRRTLDDFSRSGWEFSPAEYLGWSHHPDLGKEVVAVRGSGGERVFMDAQLVATIHHRFKDVLPHVASKNPVYSPVRFVRTSRPHYAVGIIMPLADVGR